MSGFRHHRTVSGSPSRSNPCDYSDWVTKRLRRYYGTHDLHFIPGSCYRRQPELGSTWRRDLFLKILEEARRKFRRPRICGHARAFSSAHHGARGGRPVGGDEGDQGAFVAAGEPEAKASVVRRK